jgi:outer membrane protein assembly factor BamB
MGCYLVKLKRSGSKSVTLPKIEHADYFIMPVASGTNAVDRQQGTLSMNMTHNAGFRNRSGQIYVGILLALVTWFGISLPCQAGDWPQILGPQRNGIATDESIAKTWPKDGPPLIWKHRVGEGFAGVAVNAGKVIAFYRVDRREVVEALDAKTGRPLWKNEFPTFYISRIAPDNGPRTVPLVHDEHVYLVGAGGRLHCVKLADGKTVWSRWLKKDFDLGDNYFGAGSSPIVADGKLLLNVGGRKGAGTGAGIVAFNLSDGKTIWKATDAGPSYSSPVAARIDGSEHVIFATRLQAISINPKNGDVRFSFPFGKRGPTVNAANPVVFDRQVFLSSSYGIGAQLAKIDKAGAKVQWSSDALISSQYTTSIYKDGFLYGIDGRQDSGTARLRCLEIKTRKIRWTAEDFGYATLILVGDQLLAMKTNGQLVVVQASPDKFTQLATAKIATGTTRALPALADGLLYVRNQDSLFCVRVGEK